MKRSFQSSLILITVLFLSACQTTSQPNTRLANYEIPPLPYHKPATPKSFVKRAPIRSDSLIATNDYYSIPNQIQCVPHARKVSGIPIRGDAHTWWPQAKGRYERSKNIPQIGSVMVLSKTNRLKYGHVAVVKNIIDDRTIEVEHANWGGTMPERKIVYTNMPVIDVSAENDWSKARFFNYPSQTYGSVYPVTGFILPNTYLADAGQAIN